FRVGGYPAVSRHPKFLVGGFAWDIPSQLGGDNGDFLFPSLDFHGASPSPTNIPFCSFKRISPFRVRCISNTVRWNSSLSKADSGPAWSRVAVSLSVMCRALVIAS